MGYITGKNPETGRIVSDEIIDALTKPPKKRAEFKKAQDKNEKSFLTPDTEDNLQRLFYEKGWTDGLPVILRQRNVSSVCSKGHPHPRMILWQNQIHLTLSRLQLWMLAIVAVMAGARPEFFPVILAVVATGERGQSWGQPPHLQP
jgi:hypothetical protein